MSPMLARVYGPKYNAFPCFLQPKLNGVRAVYGSEGVFQSRDEKLWKPHVVSHILDELETLKPMLGPQAMLDGEFYIHGWRLQKINGAIAVNRIWGNEDSRQVQYHVFDYLSQRRGGFSAPFSQRYTHLLQIDWRDFKYVKLVPTDYVKDRTEVDQYFRLYTAANYEGVMLRPDGPYEPGVTPHGTQKRSQYLWKYKQWEDAEWRCVGWTRGEGKADIGIGALVLALEGTVLTHNDDGTTTIHGPTFKVGTGFTDEERIEFMNNPPIGKLVRVRYLELTEDGIPFNPSFLAVIE